MSFFLINLSIFSQRLPNVTNQIRLKSRFRNRYKERREKVIPLPCRKLKSMEASVATKGFLRCLTDYNPPEDLLDRISSLFGPVEDLKSPIPDSARFSVFNQCFVEFHHEIPNSILHKVSTYEDVIEFYSTPVQTTLPLDKFKSVLDPPPNLHIQYEPLRFHPDEDTIFKGQTAFPKSNTLVTGLRTRKKYRGSVVTPYWPE